MSDSIPKLYFDIITQTLSDYPEGASLSEILEAIKEKIPRRTLQRWMGLLVKDGHIIAEGHARAKQYRLPEAAKHLATEKIEESIIPLSSAAKNVQATIHRPLSLRRHVSYHREFLEDYIPNRTFYLDAPIRKRLQEMGQSPDGNRPAGTYARQIFSRLLIDLSWNSSRLEGNTYSLLETERLLELGTVSEGKNFMEAQMILNHKAAIEFLVESAGEIDIDRYTILNLHALLSNNLLGNSKSSGSLRTIAVGIAKTVYHPLAVPQLINECFQQILDKARAVDDAFEKAFFLMVHLPYLQPFEDVNKRVSRLAANLPLIRENLCPLSFVDVPQDAYVDGLLAVYELNRIELLRDVFIWAYERSCSLYSATRKTLGEPDPFRLHYRELIKSTINEIVSERMNKTTAIATIRQLAREKVLPVDQSRFVEVVETELMSLHEGNIARYQLRRKDFEAWQLTWR